MTRPVRPIVVVGDDLSALVAAVLRSIEIITAVCVAAATRLAHEGRGIVEGVASVDVRGIASKR